MQTMSDNAVSSTTDNSQTDNFRLQTSDVSHSNDSFFLDGARCPMAAMIGEDASEVSKQPPPAPPPGAGAMSLAKPCAMADCTEKSVYVAKRTLNLCKEHNSNRDALLLQASKGAPVEVMGVKMGLREYLEDMELKDPGAFMEQLKDFSQKCLGSSRWQVGAHHRRY